MTVDSREFVDRIIAGNGWSVPPSRDGVPYDQADPSTWDDDNMPVVKVVEYQNAWGRTAWGCVLYGDADPNRYERVTEYIIAPRVLWVRPPVVPEEGGRH